MTLSRAISGNRLLLTRLAAAAIVAGYWLGGPPPGIGWLAAGTMLILLGQGLRLWAAGHLVKQEALTTTGPFAHLRHPLYWGSLLSGIGFCVATRLWWSYLLVAAVFGLAYVPTLIREERRLLATFGDAYRAYCAAVPRFGLRLSGYQGGPAGPQACHCERSEESWPGQDPSLSLRMTVVRGLAAPKGPRKARALGARSLTALEDAPSGEGAPKMSGFSWRRAADNGEHRTVLGAALLLAALWLRSGIQ